MIEQNGIDYEVFVDCTPLHDDVPNDPVLEAMQNRRRRLNSFEGKRSQVDEASVKPPLIYLRQTAEEHGENVSAAVSGRLVVRRAETKAGPRRLRHAARPPWLPSEWRVEKEPRSQGRKAGCLDSVIILSSFLRLSWVYSKTSLVHLKLPVQLGLPKFKFLKELVSKLIILL